jgi:(S)-ureidoglycine aminohydrolase
MSEANSTPSTRDRGRRGAAFTLLTPANRYMSRLPSLPGVGVFKLITPRLEPARFGQYLLEIPASGARCPLGPQYEHFLYGLGGQTAVISGPDALQLGEGGFAYVPPSMRFDFKASGAGTVLWIKRIYQRSPGLGPPEPLGGHVAALAATPAGVAGLARRELLDPDDPAFDFNISLMSFDPGVGLPQIEIHDEEHGLYMTAGSGVYLLDGERHDVQTDDFIYMAPYCPQGFEAGADGASYLLYKDVYRDGF